ncbi:Os12g0448400 [Oryza sativa Japonica Group]|uniref:Expressed protein n=1 Tax=Oryza sativa subsp. japonica TaxID=39947 RepID=Q2QRW0_ORYSJ|nr:expressed protein [Oryza sativa Japonica Group]BAG88286.1 unnamed protein product [Oryza sativa Japonica Group]BAT17014.1 Os12g0448400 [Oryza sativa Japonica Group]
MRATVGVAACGGGRALPSVRSGEGRPRRCRPAVACSGGGEGGCGGGLAVAPSPLDSLSLPSAGGWPVEAVAAADPPPSLPDPGRCGLVAGGGMLRRKGGGCGGGTRGGGGLAAAPSLRRIWRPGGNVL